MDNKPTKPLRDRIAKAIQGEVKLSVDPELIRELAQLLQETGLGEIEIERGGARVRVATAVAVSGAAVPAAVVAPAASPTSAPMAAAPEPATRKGTIVTSPMVGTVYLSPQPGASPFVKIGDAVSDGTLCIIEAMKTMNPVPSPVAGLVAEIFVRDGQPVEFGEPLMRIE